MPYRVTAKGRPHELRDGRGPYDKMYLLKPNEPVIFKNLPCGYTPPGDGQIEVVEIAVVEEIKIAEPVVIEDEETPAPKKHKKVKK